MEASPDEPARVEGQGEGHEEPRVLVSGRHRLAALVAFPTGAPVGSVAIGHPHPGHGGRKDHSVVAAVARSATRAGLVALRFDVRGAGESEGDVADAAGHVEDLRVAHEAAAREVGVHATGTHGATAPRAYAAGFSYGARLWLEALASAAPPTVAGAVLLAPATRIPRTARDFGDLLLGREIRGAPPDFAVVERLAALRVPTRVLVGERDEVSEARVLRDAAPAAVRVVALPGLNHFFSRAVGAGPPDVLPLEAALDAAWRELLSLEL